MTTSRLANYPDRTTDRGSNCRRARLVVQLRLQDSCGNCRATRLPVTLMKI
jgi:hypothetical protein